jgi:uncharacterized membrane protein YkgB
VHLNCFGIGYLLAGLKKRWLIALGGNLLLLLIVIFITLPATIIMGDYHFYSLCGDGSGSLVLD